MSLSHGHDGGATPGHVSRTAHAQAAFTDPQPYGDANRTTTRLPNPATDAQTEGTHELPDWRSPHTGRSPTPDPAGPRSGNHAPRHPAPHAKRSTGAPPRRSPSRRRPTPPGR